MDWLTVCDPMQLPLAGEKSWTKMEPVYHNHNVVPTGILISREHNVPCSSAACPRHNQLFRGGKECHGNVRRALIRFGNPFERGTRRGNDRRKA